MTTTAAEIPTLAPITLPAGIGEPFATLSTAYSAALADLDAASEHLAALEDPAKREEAERRDREDLAANVAAGKPDKGDQHAARLDDAIAKARRAITARGDLASAAHDELLAAFSGDPGRELLAALQADMGAVQGKLTKAVQAATSAIDAIDARRPLLDWVTDATDGDLTDWAGEDPAARPAHAAHALRTLSAYPHPEPSHERATPPAPIVRALAIDIAQRAVDGGQEALLRQLVTRATGEDPGELDHGTVLAACERLSARHGAAIRTILSGTVPEHATAAAARDHRDAVAELWGTDE